MRKLNRLSTHRKHQGAKVLTVLLAGDSGGGSVHSVDEVGPSFGTKQTYLCAPIR